MVPFPPVGGWALRRQIVVASASLVFLVVGGAWPRNVEACTCDDEWRRVPAGAAVFAHYDAIFEGRVLPARPPADAASPAPPGETYREKLARVEAQVDSLFAPRDVRFEVLATWKGSPSPPVVRTEVQPLACAYPFRDGRVYLVYAIRRTDGALWTCACDRTRPVEEAQDDLATLGVPGARLAAPPHGCAGCATAPGTGSFSLAAFLVVWTVLQARRRRGAP